MRIFGIEVVLCCALGRKRKGRGRERSEDRIGMTVLLKGTDATPQQQAASSRSSSSAQYAWHRHSHCAHTAIVWLPLGRPPACNALPCITGHVPSLWRLQLTSSTPYRPAGGGPSHMTQTCHSSSHCCWRAVADNESPRSPSPANSNAITPTLRGTGDLAAC